MIQLCAYCFLALVLLPGFGASGIAAPNSSPIFIDLDGDGLDDSLIDFRDGFFLEDAPEAGTGPGGGIGSKVFDAFADLEVADVDLPQTKRNRFISRSFSARSCSSCRGDYDAEFSGGVGASSGGGGKTCVGGVCY